MIGSNDSFLSFDSVLNCKINGGVPRELELSQIDMLFNSNVNVHVLSIDDFSKELIYIPLIGITKHESDNIHQYNDIINDFKIRFEGDLNVYSGIVEDFLPIQNIGNDSIKSYWKSDEIYPVKAELKICKKKEITYKITLDKGIDYFFVNSLLIKH